MTNDARRAVFNTRERALSTDLNNATDLIIRQMINNLAFAAAPDELASLNLYGVVNGLLVGSTGVALTVVVDVGLALKYDAAAADVYDSKYRLVEVSSPVTIDVSSYVNPGNPRWIVIEITPGSAIESMSLRDIFNPASGLFVAQSIAKVMKSEPVVSVTAGTPSAGVPALPLGTPGRIPLAYVYLPAGALVVNPDQIIRCRPLLTPRFADQNQNLIGGGFYVEADGDSVAFPAGSAQFRPAFFPAPISIDSAALQAAGGLDLDVAAHPSWYAGQSYPAVTAPIYLYLMAAPYPAGYDTSLAGREFVPGDQAAVAALIPSYAEGVAGGLLVASTTAPIGNDAPIGTHLGLALSGPNDPTWNGGPGVSALTQGRVAYVGAVTWLLAAAGLLSQWTENRSHVRFTTTPGGDQTYNMLGGGSAFNQLGSFAFEQPMSLLGARWAPQTANGFEVYNLFTSGTDCIWHLSVAEPASTSPVASVDGTGVTLPAQGSTHTFNTHAGLFRWEVTNNGVAAVDQTVQVWGYDDSMLERT